VARDAVDFVERTGGVHLELPADPGSAALARMLLHSLAQRRDLDDERVEDLVLAVSEACSIGASAEAPARAFEVRWSEEPDRVVIEVVHPGETTLQTSSGASGPPTDPGRAAIEGRLRLPLILELVDELDVDGDRVRMTVYCSAWEGLEEG